VSVHFRHGGSAMVGFADGSAGFLPMEKSTLDSRAPQAAIGRFAPKGSTKYLLPQPTP
jgi:prepilin-type processing-associated H-X9-DG protein